MTESAWPLRFDHPLARILDDPFALPIETGPEHDVEDPSTNENERTTQCGET
jgi:hypothetical protein